jgi:hypothetical protein
MTTREEKMMEGYERVSKELGRESTRDVFVTEDGSTTRIELRPVSWMRWLIAGFFLFFACMCFVGAVQIIVETDGAVLQAIWPLLGAAAFTLLSVFAVFSRESIVISSRALSVSSGIGRLRVTRRVPLGEVTHVRVEAFSFASWDPYVVVGTNRRTWRIAWGVPDAGAHEITRLILRALPSA